MKLKGTGKLLFEMDKKRATKIENIYFELFTKFHLQTASLNKHSNQIISETALKNLKKQLLIEFQKVGTTVINLTNEEIIKISEAVVEDTALWLDKYGLYVEGAFINVPSTVLKRLATGEAFKGNWTLSKSIWADLKKKEKDINNIIKNGIEQSKSAYDIAKDLEIYVNPKAKKPMKWNKVYPNSGKVIDYNAQRLARTMVSKAYRDSLVMTVQKNPFCQGILWRSSGVKTCPLCAERDGMVYKVDELPEDHPNGMCTYLVVLAHSNTIADRLANWANGKEDPQIDAYVEDIYQQEYIKNKVKSQVKERNK